MILLDLLNDNLSNRAFAEDKINRALEHMEASDFLYLYLLTNEGQVYPIHPVPAASPQAAPENNSLDRSDPAIAGECDQPRLWL